MFGAVTALSASTQAKSHCSVSWVSGIQGRGLDVDVPLSVPLSGYVNAVQGQDMTPFIEFNYVQAQ